MKTKVGMLIIAIFTVLLASSLSEGDFQKKYTGQSNCLPELRSADHYGIRLDRSQTAYLDAYQWKGKNILAIVQYKQEGERCGVIRDVAQSRDATSAFIFECTDRKAPSDVVVGTWPETYRRSSGTTLEAWRIDLKDLKFAPVKGTVYCVNRDYSGRDEGDDLATWARMRVAKRSVKPKR
jgi:hypothetical protein